MVPKKRGTTQRLLWVSCVLFQLTVIVHGQSNSTIDGATFNATIARVERPLRFDLGPGSGRGYSVPLPLNGTTKPDAIIALSPSLQANVDIFCSPGAPAAIDDLMLDIRTAVWRSDHAHGDDFVFISHHHPRYDEGFLKTGNGDFVEVFCRVRNNEYYPASITVEVDFSYGESIEMRREDEEVIEAIFANRCCQSDDSCKEWKEHRSNNGSVQSDLCHFHMNFCNSDGHLVRLSLENLNMQCEFPYEEITQFKQLRKILLKGNKFTGNINGVLTALSELPELEDVDISDSQLTGSLAGSEAAQRSGVCTLARMELLYLNLEHNDIAGELPDCLLNASARVKTILLASNKIRGKLPTVSEFSRMLETLDLTGNQLSGEIPGSYAEGAAVEILYLSKNQLTGSVPDQFGSSSSLRHLNLSSNELSGPFPKRLTESRALRELDLSNNDLTGELPDSIGMMSLDVLVLGSNNFAGSLPSSLSNLTFLRVLVLSNNSLTGSIMNVLPLSLFLLDLSDNQFTGAISGTVSRIGDERMRCSVRLSNNDFSSFDKEWYRKRAPMLRLARFEAANNNINGRFPTMLANAVFLRELDLSNNNLSGSLPSKAGVVPFLFLLNLSSNAFTGNIPESWERSRLFDEDYNTSVDLSFNKLFGPIPDFFYETPMNKEVIKTIDLEGNDFDVECPLPKRLSSIHGLVCNPDYTAPPIEEDSLTTTEPSLPKSSLETSAESAIERPEALYTSTTTDADSEASSEFSILSSSNAETTGAEEGQSREGGSNKSNIEAWWIPVVVVAGFALLLAVFLAIRRRSNAGKVAATGGAVGGGKKPGPLVSLSTLKGSKALPPQREPSKDDGVHMLTGVQSSAEV